MAHSIHVIDQDVRRRAKVAHELCCYGRHVEIYEDVSEFLAVAPTDGFILAADNPDGQGNALDDIRSLRFGLPTIAYAENPPIERVVQVMLVGLAGYLSWPFNSDELLDTLDRMLEANAGHQLRERAMAKARSRVEELTPRERQVLAALIGGMSNKEMARSLSISPRTVEIHRGHMMTRLGANSIAEAVKIGLYAGLDDVSFFENRAPSLVDLAHGNPSGEQRMYSFGS